ncbi:MAG: hypothetical protein ACKV2Q_09215 [Planctomycetaceae bacterium]
MLSQIRMLRSCLVMVVTGLGLLAGATLAEAATKPIGRLLEVTGEVRVLDESGTPRPAEVFGSVYANETLELAEKASVVVSFRSERLERISKVKKAILKESGVEPKEAATSLPIKAKSQKLVGDSLAALDKGVGGVTVTRSAGAAEALPAVSPIVGCTVRDTPTFIWPAQDQAKSYSLILKGPKLKKGQWKANTAAPPVKYDGDVELEDDKEYRWEVFVTLNGGQVESLCNGSFHTADADTREAATDLVELADDTEPALVALAAIRLEELELFAEAIRQYERLIKLAPRRPEFHAALSELYDKAGQSKKAADSREAAKKLGYAFAKEKSTKEAPANNQ